MIPAALLQRISAIYGSGVQVERELRRIRSLRPHPDLEWQAILAEIRRAGQPYHVRDFTNLKDAPAFGCEIALIPAEAYQTDDILLARQHGGQLRIVRAFTSLVYPAAYVHAFPMVVPEP